jgi:hypothetical protein
MRYKKIKYSESLHCVYKWILCWLLLIPEDTYDLVLSSAAKVFSRYKE